MAILFELSESIIKRAALISSKFPDRTLLSVIEECFEFGARSLYTDAPKPVPPQRVVRPIEEMYAEPPTEEEMRNINSLANSVVKKANEDYSSIEDSDDSWGDSYSEISLNSDGLYEL